MILPTLIEEFRATIALPDTTTPRRYRFPVAKNIIKVAMGMRRSGKTYFLYQTIRKLLSEGVPLQRILYINFEDDRLLPMNHKTMGQLIDSWYTLQPENHHHECHLFLDEVQNVEEWPLVLRRLFDTKKIQLYVTGSSAKLLSKEIATSLRGRSLAIEIFPYSYLEYLETHHLQPPSPPLGKQSIDFQQSYLLNYFQVGGFPAVQSMPPNEQLETLQNYVETVIFRDIVERHQIDNISLLKYLISSLLKNVGSRFSINKFYNDIKSQGHKAGKDTLHTYLSYLEDAFLIFTVPLFTESTRQRQTAPKKIYAIDNGLIRANTFNVSDNLGKCLENQVYLDLRRQGKTIFHYLSSEGLEVDFITRDSNSRHELIQVVWDATDPHTLEREERALRQAENELGFPSKLIDKTTYLETFCHAPQSEESS